MKKTIKGQFYAKIDRGRVRVTNEDQALAIANASGDVLLAVCDGMGGHKKGDYASRMAINLLADAFKKKSSFNYIYYARYWLTSTIKRINAAIYNESFTRDDYKDMGTTMVVALLIKDTVIIANVGDSRAYGVRYESLRRLTEDQTYVDYLYRMGKISEEEIKTRLDRHVLMNAVGIFPSLSIDIKMYPNIGNPILLCSDGLYNNISEKDIHAILHSDDRIETKVETLISVANANGGSDNMAVAYWETIVDGENR